ncbi:hypothetical protein FB45DRAFT_1112009 [Roridomyces roridus]|uniref:F-box domain-containing protein n=1 Tax=Roridomyces roridus TaxID=1738132 RepID=A0AAD7B8P2_9AGAR|nr:hypothetical protein FB45DRAFT_1112009 [Roridomyces roridus]
MDDDGGNEVGDGKRDGKHSKRTASVEFGLSTVPATAPLLLAGHLEVFVAGAVCFGRKSAVTALKNCSSIGFKVGIGIGGRGLHLRPPAASWINPLRIRSSRKKTASAKVKTGPEFLQNSRPIQVPDSDAPAEITSEIFIHSLPSDYDLTPLVTVGPHSPSFLLQICRQWRDIALGVPALWSSFRLDFHDSRHSLREQRLERLGIWLKRSRNCPLSIPLWDEGPDQDAASIPTSNLFVEAIMRHASRLQHVDIEVGPSENYILPDTTPSETAVGMLTLAPNLRKLVLSMKCNPFTISLPWSQLTTLTAELYIPEAIYVLGQTTALETCTLTIYGCADPAPAHPVVSLLRLHSLGLYWGSDGEPDGSLVALVSALTLPALDSLIVPEFFLGSDPIAALSRLRPQGYPLAMGIQKARLSFDLYRESFPDAVLSVEFLEED